MSNDAVSSHEAFQKDLAEFALGILDGRARASLLDHVETCPECAQSVQELTAASDALLHIPIGVEAPLGFESAIIERIRSTQSTPVRRGRFGAAPMLAAAAAVVLISFALGGLIDRAVSKSPTSLTAEGKIVQRTLTFKGRSVGLVYAYTGSPSWMFVTVNEPGAPSTVRCTVVTTNGAQHFVGNFTLTSGHGAWGTAIPVSFTSVRNVQLTSPSGAPVANLASTTWNYPRTHRAVQRS